MANLDEACAYILDTDYCEKLWAIYTKIDGIHQKHLYDSCIAYRQIDRLVEHLREIGARRNITPRTPTQLPADYMSSTPPMVGNVPECVTTPINQPIVCVTPSAPYKTEPPFILSIDDMMVAIAIYHIPIHNIRGYVNYKKMFIDAISPYYTRMVLSRRWPVMRCMLRGYTHTPRSLWPVSPD